MIRSAFVLAAVLAGSTLSNAAEAGGIRIGLGFPLGSLMMHHTPAYSAGPASSYAERKVRKPVVAHRQRDDDTPPRKGARATSKKIEIAKTEPAPRKPKPQIAVREDAPVAAQSAETTAPINTARLEDNAVAAAETSTIVLPRSLRPNIAFTGTQSTPATIRAASNVSPIPTNTEIERAVSAQQAIAPVGVQTLCRKFSAAIGSLIDVPCDDDH